ncbi:hypothetical protein C1S99_18085 [Vibrio parahaemolyticus]|uniref:hypothetical protein n=1 Tax=Vibrio parahaemolyticus TaxID=670 RepID=UPI000C86A4C6|nr:hypothetical protein [Vibrio parahaemolyticus]MDG3058860.1 hypothetical protein [Vibrio parahaemolyticus]PMS40166.1 hypothetical protein C1T12_19970 [Vibrio parahaemolyticus]PMS60938.1 hypothetical protein C1S91_20815 [Vibrio parahaemolyticus]PMS66422.1 hypothetical protein C1S96_19275 [Vibrio parahaemolyticus]PMS71318.1 hypothetical protein C1T10_20810 [Vibrio parahaemolyticus]
MAEATTNGSSTTLDLKQSFALLSVDKNGIVTMKFGDEVTVFMNDKCPAITTDLLKVIASIKNGSSQQ